MVSSGVAGDVFSNVNPSPQDPAPHDGFTCSGSLQIWGLAPCLDSAGVWVLQVDVFLLFPGQ